MSLIKYLPYFYKDCEEVSSIIHSENIETEKIKEVMSDLINQFFIDTATWGLELWENEFGLVTDKTKPYNERREALIAKKRGQGTVTKAMIKQVAESFAGGEVDVIEIPSEYRFIIKFVGIVGIPKNMKDFTNVIEEIKPAHLGYVFEFRFNTHKELSKLRHSEMALKTHKQLREVEIIGK